jgi:formiminotetrahydrofolate cyclodeaminase
MNPRSVSETSIGDFLTAVASAEEAHGAVSTAAVAGGLGCSLLLMVATLPRARSDSIDDRTRLVEAAAALSSLQEQLIETIETETAVKVFAARHLPQASVTQGSERQTAIQFALRAAADVPLEVMRLCTRGLQQAKTVAKHGPRAAFTDIELGVALLHTAFNGARSNLEAKLGSLTNAVYIKSVVEEMAQLTEEATFAASAAGASLQVPPA